MNHLMSSDSNEKLIDPKKLLEGIKSLEKGFTTDNEDLGKIMSEYDVASHEQKDDEIDSTMTALRRKLTSMCKVDDHIAKKISKIEGYMENLDRELKDTNLRKLDGETFKGKSKKRKQKMLALMQAKFSEVNKNHDGLV